MFRTFKIARMIRRVTRRGDVVITCPAWLAGPVKAFIWERQVQHAADKWAGKEAGVPLLSWREATTGTSKRVTPPS